MKIVGITGGSGSGKSTVMRMFERLGAYTIDADEIYHRQLETNSDMKKAIISRFPDAAPEGVIDRRKLGALVFTNKDEMSALNAVTHKYVLTIIRRMLEAASRQGVRMAVIDAILIIETDLDRYCDYIIGVTATPEVRAERISLRDGIELEYALERISAQKDDSFYRMHCDCIIENNGEGKEVEAIISSLYDDILQGKAVSKRRRSLDGEKR